jgi:signal transduction histidine kinase
MSEPERTASSVDHGLVVGQAKSSRTMGSRMETWLRRKARRLAKTEADLIAPLGEVASAVSSKLSIDEILSTVVDEAKRLIETDKAVLCLVDDYGDGTVIDQRTIVVRGRRSEYPEEWWLAELEGVSGEVFEEDSPRVTYDRSERAWLLCVPVKTQDRPIGLLAAINSHAHGFNDEQIAFLAILGAFAGSAIENARLASEARISLLAGERSRISREMHDGLSQSLFSLALGMEVCRKQILRDPDKAYEKIGELQSLLSESQTELRRYIYDLRPVSLDRLGLVGALEFAIAEITEGGHLRGRLVVMGSERPLAPAAEACLFRVAQEAMANVAKHARARYFRVALSFEHDSVDLAIEDNGRGFNVERAQSGADEGRSLGLRSIRERAKAEGGTVEVMSKRGYGTSVRVHLPC